MPLGIPVFPYALWFVLRVVKYDYHFCGEHGKVKIAKHIKVDIESNYEEMVMNKVRKIGCSKGIHN